MMWKCNLSDIKGVLKHTGINYFWPYIHNGRCAIGFVFEARKYGYWLVVVYDCESRQPVEYDCLQSDLLHVRSNNLDWYILECLHAPRTAKDNNLVSFRFSDFSTIKKLPRCF